MKLHGSETESLEIIQNKVLNWICFFPFGKEKTHWSMRRFQPNFLSRGFVRVAIAMSQMTSYILPETWQAKIAALQFSVSKTVSINKTWYCMQAQINRSGNWIWYFNVLWGYNFVEWWYCSIKKRLMKVAANKQKYYWLKITKLII